MEAPIEHISDTARWVAVYRAMETERPDAHFRDPYARRLAGERGQAIVNAMPQGKANAWPMIVRTCVMDEIIQRVATRDGADTVINLAAGLDARAYRLPLPSRLRWVDVDLPGIQDYKRRELAGEQPACALEYVPLDLADAARRQELFARVGAAARQVLVVSEGLLVYLAPDQVAALAADLHAQPTFRWWLMDLASPRVLKMMERRWRRHLARGGARMQFAPAEGTQFFAAHGWRELEFRSVWTEAKRLKRMISPAWPWLALERILPRKQRESFTRLSGVVLLGRA